MLLLQHLNHHIVGGLVDKGNHDALAVDQVIAVGILCRGCVGHLPDEVPGKGLRQLVPQGFHGQCIFAVDSTAGATWMGTHAPLLDISAEHLADFETVVMKVPQFDPDDPQMISQGPSVCIFNKPVLSRLSRSSLAALSLMS